MRNILTLEFENGNLIYVIGSGGKSKIKSDAIKLSPRLLGDEKMFIKKETPIVKVESWEEDNKSTYQNGNKQYMVSFLLDNVVQLLYINSAGVKSAYNNIKIKFGIQENLFMIIYETTQQVKKKSAMKQSMDIYRNREKVHELLKMTSSKVKNTMELTQIRPEIGLLLNMIRDNYTGKYKMNDNQIGCTLACLIYFNEPYTTIQDVINGDTDLSDIAMMQILISTLKIQLHNYENYYKQQKQDGSKTKNKNKT